MIVVLQVIFLDVAGSRIKGSLDREVGELPISISLFLKSFLNIRAGRSGPFRISKMADIFRKL